MRSACKRGRRPQGQSESEGPRPRGAPPPASLALPDGDAACAARPLHPAAARHFKRADVADWALEQLALEQQREEAVAAEAAEAERQAAAAAGAAGAPAPDDHRWHGYYEGQQDEEDEW